MQRPPLLIQVRPRKHRHKWLPSSPGESGQKGSGTKSNSIGEGRLSTDSLFKLCRVLGLLRYRGVPVTKSCIGQTTRLLSNVIDYRIGAFIGREKLARSERRLRLITTSVHLKGCLS